MTTNISAERAPVGRLSRFALPLICIAQLMATLDVTIVNLALPAIDAEFSLSNAGLAWLIDAYTLGYAGLLLVGGRLGDLLGHRRTLIIGVLVFTVASLVAGLAQGAGVLLAARAGQGLGAALATPTTLSLITILYPAGPRRSGAMVAYGAMAGLGITLGLVLGGILTEHGSWRWVFLVNIPIGLLVLGSARFALPDTRGPGRPVDIAGALLGTAAMTSLVYGVIRAGSDGWSDGQSRAALGTALVAGVVFAVVERRVAEPTLPLGLLRHRARVGAYLVAGLLFACLYPSFFFLSRYLQDVLGQSPVEAGLRFLPIGVGVLGFAVVTRRMLRSVGARALVLGGTCATAAAALGLVYLEQGTGYVSLLLPCLIGLGAGVGVTFVANAAVAMTDIAEQDIGIGSGLLSTCQAVGGTIGVAALASVAASTTSHELAGLGRPAPMVEVNEALMSGFTLGFTVAGGLAALAVLVCSVVLPATVGRQDPASSGS